MTNERPPTEGKTHTFRDEELAWIATHLTDLRRSVREKRFLRGTLITALVVGLMAHAGGYFLGSSAATEPIGLVADLLYALGYALWTGVVVAVLLQIVPEWKQRQLEWYLNASEQALRDRGSVPPR
jgi:hypothetical protein